MREPVSRRANGLGLPSAPFSTGPGSKPEAAVRPLIEASRGLSFISFFQTHVVGNKGTCRFYYIAAAAGPRRGPQGRDEEIGDVAAYVIDQANGDKWDD